jgi:hypothetical protein
MKKLNNYKVDEKDIILTVSDFDAFCHYVNERNPMLSKRKEVFGKNDLFALNAQLHFRKIVTAPNYMQESYPVIDLMFNLAIQGKLYVKIGDPKENVFLEQTARLNEFMALNSFEKYCFLIETFWTQCDLSEILRWGDEQLNQIVIAFSKSGIGQELVKGSISKRSDFDQAFSSFSVIIHYFSYFGFCTFVPIIDENKNLTKYDYSIKTIIPKALGIAICKILSKQKITNWNLPWLEIYGIYMDGNEEVSKDIPLFKYFEPIFPEGVLAKTVTVFKKKIVKGSYIFQVSLEKNVWRKIKLSHKHSLHYLHLAIQEAFDFDNDHLYAFFMDGKRYSRNAFHTPDGDEGPFADEAIIGELGLYKGQKILYFFDYGDSWEFKVQLLKIDEDEVFNGEPVIVETKGEAPPQYGFYDDFDEE